MRGDKSREKKWKGYGGRETEKDMGEEEARNKIKYLEDLRERVAFEARLKGMREAAGKRYVGEQHSSQREQQEKRLSQQRASEPI